MDNNKIGKSQINLDRLRLEIRAMNRTKALYRVLKDELWNLGFWRNKPRGNPALGLKMRGKNKK
jgi:hypothetical protein